MSYDEQQKIFNKWEQEEENMSYDEQQKIINKWEQEEEKEQDAKETLKEVDDTVQVKTNGIRYGEAEKPGPDKPEKQQKINYKMTQKRQDWTRIGYWNMRRKLTTGIGSWEEKVAAWQFDVITFAEIFIDKPSANALNGFNMSETYLRKASSDNKYNGTQGPSLVTYVNRFMGFNKYFKVIDEGYIHAIDLPEKHLKKRRLILHFKIIIITHDKRRCS